MKSMLQHSFVLDALETTGADTFSHFEVLIEEHRTMEAEGKSQPSSLRQLVPTIGNFHTPLPLRAAFEIYNEKHRLTKRKHIQISFNEIRHILNLAQVMALGQSKSGEKCPNPFDGSNMDLLKDQSVDSILDDESLRGHFNGPKLMTFDGDQTLYSDGANFSNNPRLAFYLYQLLRHGVSVAVVTAAGYEYNVEKYEYRLSGLLHFFQERGLSKEECERFYLFGTTSVLCYIVLRWMIVSRVVLVSHILFIVSHITQVENATTYSS
jgi:IMP and pyridine-specific 5'-nucleotidase